MVEKQKSAVEVTNQVAIMDLSGDAKQAMEMLTDSMNWVCYIYDAYFWDLKELHEASAGGELVSSVGFLLWNPLYNVTSQKTLVNTVHDDFCDM